MVFSKVELPESGIRRIPKPIDHRVPRVRLYKDDVEELFEILTASADHVRLEADSYLAASPSAIDSLNIHAFSTFEFHASGIPKRTSDENDRDRFTLSLSTYYSSIFGVTDENLALHGLKSRILPILERRKVISPLQRFRNPLSVVWRLLYVALVALALVLIDDFWLRLTTIALAGIFHVLAEFLIIQLLDNWRKRACVVWKYEADENSWIRESASEIAKYSIAAAVGALVTVTLTLLLT